MISLNSKEGRTYLSSDRSCMYSSNFDVHTPEFLNTLKCSGVPGHEISLKVGTSVMLLRNIDHSRGLCNGTRLIITRLRDKIIEAKVFIGSSVGELTLIPRHSLTPSDTRPSFKFQRIYHDHLYVAVSRITNPSGFKILLCHANDSSSNKIKNVVFLS
ncbi:hypothetical protein ACS0TY_035686 [Phlomoides rotata]